MERLPFNATIRASTRARRLRITITHFGQVEVVKPAFYSVRAATDFLHQNHAWLEKQLARFSHDHGDPPNAYTLPQTIHLKGINTHYDIQTTPHGRGISLQGTTLTIKGATTDTANIYRLRRWIQAKAKEIIIPLLHAHAKEMNITINKISIRDQQSRWGSCSRAGDISLNQKLLLVEPRLIRYVLIHELCHRLEMNHSRAFWKLVATWEQDYRRLNQALHFRDLPSWALIPLAQLKADH